jgi:integrase
MARRIKYFAGQKETQPIKDKKQIQSLLYYLLNKVEKAKSEVKKYQADRNYMLILVGLNTAFRAEDLLQLRVIDLNGYISIKENKTGKMQNFKMNKAFKDEVDAYVKRWNLAKYDYLFLGQKKIVDGKPYNLPINRQQGHRIVSRAGDAIGIQFVFGLHSLRKTFGYQYINGGGNVLTLMKMYNHDSPDVTLRYVCWGREDAEKARENTYIGVKK